MLNKEIRDMFKGHIHIIVDNATLNRAPNTEEFSYTDDLWNGEIIEAEINDDPDFEPYTYSHALYLGEVTFNQSNPIYDCVGAEILLAGNKIAITNPYSDVYIYLSSAENR